MFSSTVLLLQACAGPCTADPGCTSPHACGAHESTHLTESPARKGRLLQEPQFRPRPLYGAGGGGRRGGGGLTLVCFTSTLEHRGQVSPRLIHMMQKVKLPQLCLQIEKTVHSSVDECINFCWGPASILKQCVFEKLCAAWYAPHPK